MKLAHPNLSGYLLDDSYTCVEWIIESQNLFTKYVKELTCQINKGYGQFALSDSEKDIPLSKSTDIILNPFAISLNDKRILIKLYSDLEKVALGEDMYTETMKISNSVYKYLSDIEFNSDYILSFDNDVNVQGLLKIMNVHYEEPNESFLERLSHYIKIIVSVLKIKFIILVNIRSFLTNDEAKALIEECSMQDVQIMLIESTERERLTNTKRYIIDKDQCEIF
ncbi:type II-A CRISPR-associated protein Csn2 [Pseudocoprococcus immobilis]